MAKTINVSAVTITANAYTGIPINVGLFTIKKPARIPLYVKVAAITIIEINSSTSVTRTQGQLWPKSNK